MKSRVAAHYEYGPFGEPLVATGAVAAEMPFQFSTKYKDTETGLYYYIHRYYETGTGRWLSRDPAEEDGGPNLYEFVTNNPLMFVDLLGLFIPKIGQSSGRGVDLDLHAQAVDQNLTSNPRMAYDDDESFTVMGHGVARSRNPKTQLPTGDLRHPFMQNETKEKHDRGYYKSQQEFQSHEPRPTPVSPKQLANMIKHDSRWGASCNVVLYSCETGYGGVRSFAQTLANILKVAVYAPTDILTMDNGRPVKIDNGGTFQKFDPQK